MRAAPAIQVSLNRFVAWRVAVLALTLLSTLTAAAWLAGREELAVATKLASVTAAAALLLWIGRSLSRPPAVSLSWDGQHWALGCEVAGGAEPLGGEIFVAVDLGPWMLLRFQSAAHSRWWRGAPSIWLPVQRAGIEPQWHALRCAVYSPRPPDAPGAADAPKPG